MHVEKGVTGRYAISLADLDEISSKGNLMGGRFPDLEGTGASMLLSMLVFGFRRSGLPSLECIEAVGHGEAWSNEIR